METPRVDRDFGQRGDGSGRYPTRNIPPTISAADAARAEGETRTTVSNSTRWLCPRCLAPSAHAGRCDRCLQASKLGNE